MSPIANKTLRWFSISVLLAVGLVMAVYGANVLLDASCLFMVAEKVSDAFTVLSAL